MLVQRVARFLRRQFLPVGLVIVAVAGILYPAPGRYMAGLPTQNIAVSVIFVCAGLRLRTDEIRKALAAWSATLWGSLSILLVTPFVGTFLASRVPVAEEFQLGLALFFCMPTTLSSGIALTGQARGNNALALLLTVLSNVAGVFTMPFVLERLLGFLGHVELSATDLLFRLCISILIPLAVGKVLRLFWRDWVNANQTGIGLLSNLALIIVPWMEFSQSSERLLQIAVVSLLILILAGMGVHVVFLAINGLAARILLLEPAESRAVVLLASQKTLPVALTVLAFLPIPAEAKGLVAIPCVTSHLGQILIDAHVATRWSNTRVADPQLECVRDTASSQVTS